MPSEPLTVSDAAETAVFYKGEEEVGRVPVRFVPGDVQTFEF